MISHFRNAKSSLALRSKKAIWDQNTADGTFRDQKLELSSSKRPDGCSFVSTMPGLPLQLQHAKSAPPPLGAGTQTVAQQIAAAAACNRGGFWQSNRVWKSDVIEAAPGTPSHATSQQRMQRSSTPGASFLFMEEDHRQRMHVEARRARFATCVTSLSHFLFVTSYFICYVRHFTSQCLFVTSCSSNNKRISEVAASLEVQRQLQAIARTAG